MASVRKTRTGRFELTIRNSKLLPKPVYLTFDDESAAKQYGEQVDRLLAAGIVPAGLVEDRTSPAERVSVILRAWLNSGQPSKSDMPLLELLLTEVGGLKVDQLTYTWAEGWVRGMKLEQNYSPGTIRKRVGAFSRALAWWMRSHPDVQFANPLQLLPDGISSYTAQDARDAAALGLKAKVDVERDRRLAPGELERIEAALAGVKRPDRERALELQYGGALRTLFHLILYTGLRLREAYTLMRGNVDLERRVIRVQTSKQRHGRIVWRDVPMRRELHALLTDYLASTEGRPEQPLFPWWDGQRDDETLGQVTTRLSGAFRRLFAYAECADLHEHDLRHEATCQWFELRRPDGAWVFRAEEIGRIMGWKPGSKMAARYASFRAEDLAARLL